jgi:hypothetical protein
LTPTPDPAGPAGPATTEPVPDIPLVLIRDAPAPGSVTQAPPVKAPPPPRRAGGVCLFLAKYVLAPLLVSLVTTLRAWLLGR